MAADKPKLTMFKMMLRARSSWGSGAKVLTNVARLPGESSVCWLNWMPSYKFQSVCESQGGEDGDGGFTYIAHGHEAVQNKGGSRPRIAALNARHVLVALVVGGQDVAVHV